MIKSDTCILESFGNVIYKATILQVTPTERILYQLGCQSSSNCWIRLVKLLHLLLSPCCTHLRLGVYAAEVGAGVAVPEVDVAISSPSPTGQQAWLPWTPCQCLATHTPLIKSPTKGCYMQHYHAGIATCMSIGTENTGIHE